MANLKADTLAHIASVGVPVKAILITHEHYSSPDYGKREYLPPNHNELEYTDFMDCLDLQYDSGYGSQCFSGIIWYHDSTWSERREYDGSEWWEHCKCPSLPEKETA